MQSVASRLEAVAGSLPQHVSLVAVSKFHPAEAIRQAYDAGQRIFAESRVQEIVAKIPQLPADIRWHFIGHLQTNKVRALVGTRRIDLIESVDSARLLDLIDRAAADEGIVQKVLIQLHVAKEETKFGLTPDEALEFFTSGRWHTLRATHICGLMGIASNTDDRARVAADFESIAETGRRIVAACPDLRGFDILSMGMSHDYMAAIEAGSTHVRIGTAIFGSR